MIRLGQTTTLSAKCFALSHQDSLSQTLRRRVMSSIRWERLHISICFVFYILSFHLSCGRDYIFHIFNICTFSQSIVPLRLLMRRNTNPKWFRRTQFLMVRNSTFHRQKKEDICHILASLTTMVVRTTENWESWKRGGERLRARWPTSFSKGGNQKSRFQKFRIKYYVYCYRCRLNFTEDDVMWAIGGWRCAISKKDEDK